MLRTRALAFSLALPLVFGALAHAGPTAAVRSRWTADTPDAMVDAAQARATAGGAKEPDQVASLVVIASLADRATYGKAVHALESISTAPAVSAEVRGEAQLLAQSLGRTDGSPEGVAVAKSNLGIVTDLALLGPFRDTGGGLDAKDGPESPGASFADARARYSWGTIDVAWRAVPPAFARAAGLPLDVFIHPRKESCSWVASTVTTSNAKPIVVRLAATGQVRLMFDGVEVGRSEDVHGSAWFDRVAARVDAAEGAHLVAAKVCTGALEDQGRVRIRVTDTGGAPLALKTRAELVEPSKKAKRPTVQKLTTPLARTLTAGGDLDSQLDAAIVRTLGGADDLRSPRASGLLSTITRAPEVGADRLAMAGWIAPSGANRSGWLNRARTLAASSGDKGAAAFVERRLIAQHLQARLSDWAMATWRGSDASKAHDSEAVLLGAMVNQALGTDALRIEALRTLAAATDAAPNDVPSALVRTLADAAESYDPKRALAAREILTQRGEPGAAWVEAAAVRGRQAVVDAAGKTFAGSLDEADEGLDTATAVSRAGAHDAARDLFAAMTRFSPNRAEAWAGLADEIAAVGGGTGVSEATTAALRRARELAPGEARYRAELALRQREGSDGEKRDDERYLVPSQQVLARRKGVPSGNTAPDVADRELYWMRAVVMHPDRRVSELIQYAREIVIAPRTQEELFEDIPAEGDLTEILRARVHRKDGGTAFPTEEHNEGTRARIRWPELSPGDTVEVAIRSWTGGPVGGRGDPPFYRLDYAGAVSTHPLLYNEVVVESAQDHPIYVDVLNGAADKREEKDERGRHVTRLVWDKPKMVADEPLAPAISEIVPVIVMSTFKDWSAFRAWYKEAVRGFTEPDEEVKRLAAELTKGKKTREEKLEALFNFVADDIRYVNYVSGEWWLPNRPQQLLARREGDCDDKAILLITLLRAVGIDAQEVMVQTRMTGQPSILLGKGAAVPLFDHGIAYLPGRWSFNGGAQEGMYLDATSPQSRLGPLPSMDARAVAFRVDSGPAEVVHLPASSPTDHGSEINWTLTLHPDGSGDLAGEETHTGDGAFWLRSNLTEAGARAQYVEDRLVGSWFPTVQVDKQVDFKGDLSKGRAWVKYGARSEGFARHEHDDLVAPLSPSTSLAAQLAPLVRRTLPVSLPPYLAPTHETRTTRVVAPAGYRWADLPPGGDQDGGKFGRAHLEIARDPKDPRAVVVRRMLVFDESNIPVEQYGAWRAWIQRVDALMHKSVRLVREGDGLPRISKGT